jgi:hypothetical protein
MLKQMATIQMITNLFKPRYNIAILEVKGLATSLCEELLAEAVQYLNILHTRSRIASPWPLPGHI